MSPNTDGQQWIPLVTLRVYSTPRLGTLLALEGLQDEDSLDGPFVTMQHNWAPFSSKERQAIRERLGVSAFSPCTTDYPTSPHQLPAGPAVVTFRVSVSDRNSRDVTPFAEQLKELLQDAIRNAPTPDEAAWVIPTVPLQRQFLFHCQDKAFQKDCARYKLWKRGLNCRQIAFLEQERQDPTVVSEDDISRIHQRIIGHDVPGESSVYESVRRAYEAIFLEPFDKAAERRLRESIQGAQGELCPEHGTECPIEVIDEEGDVRGFRCAYANRLYSRLDKILPSQTSGRLRGELNAPVLAQCAVCHEATVSIPRCNHETDPINGGEFPSAHVDPGVLAETVRALVKSRQALDSRERAVLRFTYGLGEEERDPAEIALNLGLSPRRVEQLLSSAQGKLKEAWIAVLHALLLEPKAGSSAATR